MTGQFNTSKSKGGEPLSGTKPPRPLIGIQVLRGIAALLVVANHAVNEAENRNFIKTSIDVDFGGFGVDVFFVISGFIMVYSNAVWFGIISSVPSFIVRRVVRIFPLYWIVCTVFLVMLKTAGEDPGLNFPYIIASYLLFPYPEPQDGADFPFYFLGWTLEFEMFFYLCFSVSLIWRRSVGVSGLCAFMMAYLAFGSVLTFPPPFNYWVSSQLLEFLAGCLVAEVYLRGLRLTALTCRSLSVGASFAVFVSWYFLGGWPVTRGVVWGLPAMALVGAATLRPARAAHRFELMLARFGDASYSLYLVHSLVFLVVYQAIRHAFRHWYSIPPVLYVVLLLFAAIVIAFSSFWYVERPLTAKLQRLFLRHHALA